MKFLLSLLVVVLFTLFACSETRMKNTLTNSEKERFSYDQTFIYYDSLPVAKFYSIEYEYYRGHKVMEISVVQLKPGMDDFTDKIVEFIRFKNPKAKVEVKVPFYPVEEGE